MQGHIHLTLPTPRLTVGAQPHIITCTGNDGGQNGDGYMVMEHLDLCGSGAPGLMRKLGTGLAKMHLAEPKHKYGLCAAGAALACSTVPAPA